MSSKNILGVRIDLLNDYSAIDKAEVFLDSLNQYKIYTPNPEMLVKAKGDKLFTGVLNRSDLNLCDGFGLSLVSGAKRVTGIDFMIDLCAYAEKNAKKIFLLGSYDDDVVLQTVNNLKKLFPTLNIVGFDKGLEVVEDDSSDKKLLLNQSDNNGIIEKINALKPDILFVAFGMGKQEKWIDLYLNKLSSVKIAIGVGGAFDFISGRIRRAPLFLRRIGLEWIWRLLKQPNRICRIFNATFKFIYYFLKYD